ncbi:hypothetical protein lerEdw1_006224 [Lerista edwardsae]|nr:hypothetical protein lerEdw1_006224 [Lerista edwardsae]
MVPSRCVKSEYMKRFKEPKWEACGPCYQELLRYRLSRRLLEQAHRPWFWDGWEQGSSLSSGGSGGSSSPPGTSSPPGAQQGEEAAVTSEAAEVGPPSAPGRNSGGSGEPGRSSPPEPLRGSEEDDDQEKADVKEVEGKSAGKGSDARTSRQQGRPPSRSALGSRGDSKSARSPERTDATKGTKHPFALYGWGEKQTNTGSQKTHNVCASASVNEVSPPP